MGKFMESVRRRYGQKKLEFKLKHGLAQRGRTEMPVEGGGVAIGGGIAGCFKTKTIARHLRRDPNGDEIHRDITWDDDDNEVIEFNKYSEIGRREVINKKVTTAFVNDIVDNLIAEVSAFGDYKFHDSGTGVVAESNADTTLGTPCAEARDTGTQIEGAQTYEYKSIATHTYAGPFAITEHGLFNIAAVGILMDRTVFAAINVISGDKIEFTFTIQFSAEA